MRRSLKIVIGMVVIAATIGALWNYHSNNLYEQSFTGQYRYEVDANLETGSKISNVTLYVPFASIDGKDMFLEDITGPKDWELSTIDTEYGRMLKISAKSIEPVHRSTPLPLEPEE